MNCRLWRWIYLRLSRSFSSWMTWGRQEEYVPDWDIGGEG